MNKYLELLHKGDYETLVNEAFPVLETDKDAARAFLRMCQSKNILFILDEHHEVNNFFIEEAEKGNRYAQFAYARKQCMVRDLENSLWISFRNMQAAADQNLPDAYAGLAMCYEYGDIGSVDRAKADELLEKSIEMGSELGKIYKLKNLCFGRRFEDAQPEKAVEYANQLIAEDEANGIEPNGWYYYYRATANESHIGRSYNIVLDDYKRAQELGILDAYLDLAMAYGYGDEGDVLVMSKEYNEYILQGLARRSAGAFFLDAAREMKRYDVLEESYRDQDIEYKDVPCATLHGSHELIHSRLSQSATLGYSGAWELLGDLYFDGMYGFEQSQEKAFVCYTNGAIHDHMASIEKLWKMMHNHYIDRPLDYVDSIALQGARNGSKRLLAETVIIHQEGRLSEYADEIEKYYAPVFDAPEFTLDNDEDWREAIDSMFGDDDVPDDDGRYDAWA